VTVLRAIRYSAVGAFFSGIVMVLQGCSVEREGALFAFLLFLLTFCSGPVSQPQSVETLFAFAVGNNGVILHTRDGGITWSIQSTPTTEDLTGISCLTPTTCFTSGDNGLILNTVDSGITWTLQATPTTDDLNDISCVSVNTCVAVSAQGDILRTDNGGGLWITQTSPVIGSQAAVDCVNINVCFAPIFINDFIHTNDGNTWVSQTTPGFFTAESISCPSVLVCFAGILLDGNMFYTNDGGTWIIQATPLTAVGNILDVDCLSNTICFAIGSTAGVDVIIQTTNGSTWSQTLLTTSFRYFGLSCVDATSCIGVGFGGSTVHTRNGTTWTPQSSPTSENLNAVAAIN